MLEEYKNTLNLIKNKKKLLLNKAEEQNLSVDNLNHIINQICELDNKIKEYEILIEKEANNKNEKDNIDFEENKNNKDGELEDVNFKNHRKKINVGSELENKRDKNVKENSKSNESKIHTIALDNDIIENIIKNKGKIEVKIIQPDNDIETKYTLKNVSKSFYFYHCTKRPKCSGKAKFNIEEKKFYITEICTDVDIHNKLTYETFTEMINNNKSHLIDFHIKKNQQNAVEYIFKNAENIENINIKKEYAKYTKIKLILTPNEISRIKTNIIGKYKTITISECLKRINDENIDLEIIENDIILIFKKIIYKYL